MTSVPVPDPVRRGTITGWLRTGSTEPCRRSTAPLPDAPTGSPAMAPSARTAMPARTFRMLES